MNGDGIKAIFEQLDERGQRYIEAIALAELRHVREGAYLARYGTLESQTHNLPMEGGKRQNEG